MDSQSERLGEKMKIKLEEMQLEKLLSVIDRLLVQLGRFNDNLERLRIVEPKPKKEEPPE